MSPVEIVENLFFVTDLREVLDRIVSGTNECVLFAFPVGTMDCLHEQFFQRGEVRIPVKMALSISGYANNVPSQCHNPVIRITRRGTLPSSSDNHGVSVYFAEREGEFHVFCNDEVEGDKCLDSFQG